MEMTVVEECLTMLAPLLSWAGVLTHSRSLFIQLLFLINPTPFLFILCSHLQIRLCLESPWSLSIVSRTEKFLTMKPLATETCGSASPVYWENIGKR